MQARVGAYRGHELDLTDMDLRRRGENARRRGRISLHHTPFYRQCLGKDRCGEVGGDSHLRIQSAAVLSGGGDSLARSDRLAEAVDDTLAVEGDDEKDRHRKEQCCRQDERVRVGDAHTVPLGASCRMIVRGWSS